MKNRLDYKLTLSLVSLFVSIILLIFGCIFKNGFCLCFGLCFSALAITLFSARKLVEVNNALITLRQMAESEELSPEEFAYCAEQIRAAKKLRKQIIWGGFAFSILLVVLGIACAV